MKKWFFLLLFSLTLSADQVSFSNLLEETDIPEPWFTGPLLAPSAAVIPLGRYNIEPYIYLTANTALYDKHWKSKKKETLWTNSQQTFLQVGLVKNLDFQISPVVYYNYRSGAAKWVFGDLPVGIDVQLYQWGTTVKEWAGALKLSIKESIPIGKYKNLNSSKKATDISGTGSWETQVGLVWGNLIYLGRGHFFDARFGIQYTYFSPVRVKNLNLYGGGAGTNGKVYPGQNFQADLGIQISLTQNWAFAFDIYGTWTAKSPFKGKSVEHVGFPTMIQYSLAPAIEYNWSSQLGLILGSWFTIAGKNTFNFTSGIVAINYYH